MNGYWLLSLLVPLALAAAAEAGPEPGEFRFKEMMLRDLVAGVPAILKSQDAETGRFGSGIWIVGDQNVILPLAAAWATESKDNPYYHDPTILEAIMSGGDALIADQDPNGEWMFRKKDGSTWGMSPMCWTYSRWIRAFSIVKDAMPEDRRKKWEAALTLGYNRIATKYLNHVHNIPAHHAMGLYVAGKTLNRPEWCKQASEFLAQVAAKQDPVGFWSENHGPVVNYNYVYVDALGTYYALSRDPAVLGALERAARFHAAFAYPNGHNVETIDERNPYHAQISYGNVGFTFSPEGRGWMARQYAAGGKSKGGFGAEHAAMLLLYGDEGPTASTASSESDRAWVSPDGRALVRRRAPWFVCLSSYHCPVPRNRWIQDRQNFVSIYHDRVGLILGGGNTKLQPLWSTFTVGDTSLLRHEPGDISPSFAEPEGLFHVPSAAGLKKTDPVGIGLDYGPERCSVAVEPVDDTTLRIHLHASANSGAPVEAHLTLLPRIGKPFGAANLPARELSNEAFSLSSKDLGDWIEHAGWRLSAPAGARVDWPVLPHNPYVKDGAAKPGEGRIVVSVPFEPGSSDCTLTLTVDGKDTP